MQQRIFQVDQECFIIYTGEVPIRKERFLRIGNSSFLKELDKKVSFISLVTPLYPGNPFAELDIFRPGIDRKIIGLEKNVQRFREIGRAHV